MSKRLQLDLVQSPTHIVTWTWLGFALLLSGMLCASLIWRSFQTLQMQQQVTQTQLSLNQQARKPAEPLIPVTQHPVSAAQLRGLKLTSIELTTPWNALFGGLEKAAMPDIAILGLQPDSRKQQIVISGEAKNYASVLAYIDKLSKQAMLSDVYLQKHTVNDADKDKPVRFSIFAHWKSNGGEWTI